MVVCITNKRKKQLNKTQARMYDIDKKAKNNKINVMSQQNNDNIYDKQMSFERFNVNIYLFLIQFNTRNRKL